MATATQTQTAKKSAATSEAPPGADDQILNEPPSRDRDTTGAVGETFWDKLTSPFPVSWIEKLPKQLSREDRRRGKCEANGEGRFLSADGVFCGGYHARAVHLDYIGHAGITMRLNEVCTPAGWRWKPMVKNVDSTPHIPRDEFWIWLEIKDPETGKWIRKQGVGDDYRNSSKQAIGDALRNAAMRFGIGTYLWSKSEHAAELAGVGAVDAPPERHDDESATGDEKPSASQLYDGIRNSWHDYERIRQLREDVVRFGYENVKVQGPTGKVALLELAEQRGMELAEAQVDHHPPAADPETPDENVDQRTAAERIAEAHAGREAAQAGGDQ